MLSVKIVSCGAVSPVVISVKAQPAGVVQSAICIKYSCTFFGLTVFLICFLRNFGGQFRDALILHKNTYFHKNVVGGSYFGFSVKGVEFFPCLSGI